MPVGNKFAESQGLSYVPNDAYLQEGFKGSTPLDFSNLSSSGIMSQAPIPAPLNYIPPNDGGGGEDDDDDDDENTTNAGITGKMDIAKNVLAFMVNPVAFGITKAYQAYRKRQDKKEFEKPGGTQDQVATIQNRIDKEYKDSGGGGFNKSNDPTGSKERGFDMHGDGLAAMGGRAGTDFAKGGRAGYFFGGRVNYKAGGRIGFQGGGRDAGKDSDFGSEDFGGDKDDNREQYGAVGQYKTGPTSTKTNDSGNKSFFKDPKTLYDYTNLGNFPTGLTTTTPYGRLSAIMDLNKTLEEEDLEGKVQFDSSIGPVNTTTSYDTDIGPTFNASYNNGPVSIGYNNLNGINASYNNGPVSVGYNNGQATLNYSKSFAKGGRVSFKNGGLASIL